MTHRRVGFTLIELVIVILIGSILVSMALSSFGNARGSMNVRGARNTFVALHARTRAQAIELGQDVRLMFNVDGDSVVIVDDSGTTLENVQFDNEMKVDLRGTTGTLCMSARGYADRDCTSFNSPLTLEFWSQGDSSTVQILTLGQLVY